MTLQRLLILTGSVLMMVMVVSTLALPLTRRMAQSAVCLAGRIGSDFNPNQDFSTILRSRLENEEILSTVLESLTVLENGENNNPSLRSYVEDILSNIPQDSPPSPTSPSLYHQERGRYVIPEQSVIDLLEKAVSHAVSLSLEEGGREQSIALEEQSVMTLSFDPDLLREVGFCPSS